MEADLSANAFAKLLDSFGSDRESAGEKYEDLRRILTRFFEWRGAPFPEEQTDETFNRVARKLDQGAQIKNIGGYCYEVARLVCLESLKSHDVKRTPLNAKNLWAVTQARDDDADREAHLDCLDECLNQLSNDNRELIMTYYQDEKRSRIDTRKILAERLGLRRDALANRAQRLRDRLEQCVTRCAEK
jgi:DNA-directed RNA polymerase specialized sigma24 family protein